MPLTLLAQGDTLRLASVESASHAVFDAAARAEAAAQDVEGVGIVVENLPAILNAPAVAEQIASDAAFAGMSATDAATARDATALIADSVGFFRATTLVAAQTAGRTATTNGQTFHATGDDVDYIAVYRRDSASAQTELWRYLRAEAIVTSEVQQARTIKMLAYSQIPTQFPIKPYIVLDSLESVETQGRNVKNRFGTTPPNRNIFPFASVDIRNAQGKVAEAGNYVTTTTPRFATGPSGLANSAARVRFPNAAANARFDFFFTVAIPAGAYKLRYKLKSNAGAGNQTIRYRHTGKADVDTAITEGAWTTVDYSFTATGGNVTAGLVAITGTEDFLIDEIQMIEDDGTAMPVFTFEKDGNLKGYYAWKNGLLRDGLFLDNRTNKAEGLIPVKSAPTPETFTELTVMVLAKMEVVKSAGTLFELEANAEFGTSAGAAPDTAFGFGSSNFGRLVYRAGIGSAYINMLDQGWHVQGSIYKAGSTFKNFLDKMLLSNAGLGPASITARQFLFAGPRGLGWGGRIAKLVIFNRALTSDEYRQAVQALIEQHSLTGEVMGSFKDYIIWEGDSITINYRGGTEGDGYNVQLMENGAWLPQPNIVSRIYGNSGAVLGTPEGPNVANSGFGRLPSVLSAIADAKAAGLRPIVTVFFGANDGGIIPTDPTTYFNRLAAYWTAIRAAGAKVVPATILPHLHIEGFEAGRQAVNTMIRNNPQLYDALMDFGGDPQVGAPDAAQPGPYYYDVTHPNKVGHTIMAGIAKAAVAPLRLS